MNCQQFTSLMVEAARGQMMDAAARDGATRHAETCEACAARLAQEQNLTSALRTVASGMRDLSAPAHVEAKLLAAFRESRVNAPAAAAAAAAAATEATPAPVTTTPVPATLPSWDEFGRRASARRRLWRTPAAAATSIAASLALFALVTLYQHYQQFTQTTPPQQERVASVSPQGGTKPLPIAPVVTTLSPPAAPAAGPPRETIHDAGAHPTPRAASRRPPAQPASIPAAPRMIASQQVIDGGSAIFAVGEGESAANQAGGAARPNEAESVTEFIPLVAGAPDAAPLESGQLVRVQMPRAALASLGLPLNAERGNEPVKADVLLGNDGLARAIRFVR